MLGYQGILTAQGPCVAHPSPFGGYILDLECLTLDAARREAARMNAEAARHIEAFNREARARTERRSARFFTTERD